MTAAKGNRAVVVIVILVTAALGVVGVTAMKRAEDRRTADTTEAPPERGVLVGVSTARSRVIAVQVETAGYLQPFEQLTISTQVPGYVEHQHVEASDRVNAGDLLFELDAALYATAIESAQAIVERAESELVLADDNVARMDRLQAQQSTNPTEVLQADTQQAIAQAMLKKSRAALQEARIMLERTRIHAPLTGEIVRVHTRQGEYAHVGQPLVDIMESERLKLIVRLNDRQIVAFVPGDPVTMTPSALPGERFDGRILRVHPRAALDSRMFEVEIEVPNNDRRLRPGFYVHAVLKKSDDPSNANGAVVLTIPRSAVFEHYRRQYCYVVKTRDDGRQHAVRTPIEIAPLLSDMQNVQVMAGVRQGDRVITTGLQHVTHESVVRISDQ